MSEVQSIQLPATGSVTTQTASNGWRSLLESNLGRRIAAEFLIGLDGMAEKSGEIYAVQSDYFLLKDDNGNYVACDLFSLKFITFCQNCASADTAQGAAEGTAAGTTSSAASVSRPPASAAAFHYARRKSRQG